MASKTTWKIMRKEDGVWCDWYNGYGWDDKEKAEANAKSVEKISGMECKVVPKVLYKYRIDWYADPYDENDDGHMGADIRWFENDEQAGLWADWNCGGFAWDFTKVEE